MSVINEWLGPARPGPYANYIPQSGKATEHPISVFNKTPILFEIGERVQNVHVCEVEWIFLENLRVQRFDLLSGETRESGIS